MILIIVSKKSCGCVAPRSAELAGSQQISRIHSYRTVLEYLARGHKAYAALALALDLANSLHRYEVYWTLAGLRSLGHEALGPWSLSYGVQSEIGYCVAEIESFTSASAKYPPLVTAMQCRFTTG